MDERPLVTAYENAPEYLPLLPSEARPGEANRGESAMASNTNQTNTNQRRVSLGTT